jgi:2-polyprenyl-6-methoxyphenol hydroxylase-like FAD-dependent oxidoreductase
MTLADLKTDPQVLIVGAGPTGLVLALWLTRLGLRVRIIDKTSAAGTTSRAVVVQARTLEFYRQIGLSDEVVNAGVKIAGANLWVRGTRAAHLSFDRLGEDFTPFPFVLGYAQDAHERLLIDHLEQLGVSIERQTTLLDFDQHLDFVLARLQRADGSQESCKASYLAGCDGASSTVRKTLEVQFPGGTYSGIFYVADVDATGPAIDDQVHVELDSSDFLAVFPLQGSGRLRLIGPVEWGNGGSHEPSFDEIADRASRKLNLNVTKLNWFSTYHVHHRVASNFRVDRAFLLGDAAHVHSPVGGQGMNTGIGDAINLSWKLSAVLDGAAENLLDSYEIERIGFARRLVSTTDRVFTFVTRSGRLARLVRTRIAPLIVPLLFRLPPVRRFLFRTVAQIDLKYRNSPLSAGRAGSRRGGDRLPWVEIEPGKDNYDPLTSLKWQVHVYGQAASDLHIACTELDLPLHAFPWQASMRRAGLKQNALYLIRPDGYISLADPIADPARLRDHLSARRGTRPALSMRK